MGSHRVVRAAVLLVLLAPAASATTECVAAGPASACVIEGAESAGDGCVADGARESYTWVTADAAGVFVDAYGYSWCSATEGTADDQDGVAAQARTPAGYAEAGWVRYGWSRGGERADACTTWVYTSRAGLVDAGCPAGWPPGLAWGALLP